MKNHNVLVDGTNILRMQLASPQNRLDWNNRMEYIGGITGFLDYMVFLKDKFENSPIFVTFDMSKSRFRKELYPEYKAGRNEQFEDLDNKMLLAEDNLKQAKEQKDQELITKCKKKIETIKSYVAIAECNRWKTLSQYHLIRLLPMLNINIILNYEDEADDVISNFVKQSGKNNTIVSTDRDFYQLVDKKTRIYRPNTDMIVSKVNIADIIAKDIGVDSYNIDYIVPIKVIEGDVSDNIKGIDGIGAKTAVGIFDKYGATKQGLLNYANDIKILVEEYNKKYKKKTKDDIKSKCPNCSNPIYTSKKYCSITCAIESFMNNGIWELNNQLVDLNNSPVLDIRKLLFPLPEFNLESYVRECMLIGLTDIKSDDELCEIMEQLRGN